MVTLAMGAASMAMGVGKAAPVILKAFAAAAKSYGNSGIPETALWTTSLLAADVVVESVKPVG